jgi:hypothetical protein
MRLFIDTNIFLDYFRTNKREMLSPLKRLGELVKSGKIELILPSQIIQEYRRKRRGIIEKMRDNLLEEKKLLLINYRTLGVSSKEVKAVDSAKKSLARAYDQLIRKFDEAVDKEATAADKIIKQLFKKAVVIDESDDVIKLAYSRYMRGNPPRKTNYSYGDAIVWETLLNSTTNDDLTLISSDSDFTEKQKGKLTLHSFLRQEWETQTKKTITFYNTLGEFINEFEENDPIGEEVIEEEKKRAENRDYVSNELLRNWVHGLTIENSSATTFSQNFNSFDSVDYSTLLSPAQKLKYCPYCGERDPLQNNLYELGYRNCKKCGRNMPYSI